MHHLPSLFIAYYLLLGAAGAVHMLLGFPKAVEQSRALLGPALSSARAVGRAASHWLVVAAAVVAVGLGVASMGRLVYPYEVNRSEAFRTFFEEQYREDWPLVRVVAELTDRRAAPRGTPHLHCRTKFLRYSYHPQEHVCKGYPYCRWKVSRRL
ncbi:hypothetical protein DIPPA_20629 [Diplonema papillatum]|nr:hypothetical protein DIPPA_20629 [Diplonema papillatum]